MTLLEVCIDDLAGARRAVAGGAGRLEVCSRLDLGGLTPSDELVSACMEFSGVPVHAMIRPRSGDFVHDAEEFAWMRRDLARLAALGIPGVVFGLVTAEREIDAARTRELVDMAKPLSITFHRAFDHLRDLERGLDVLIELGVDRVLTSGGAVDAHTGRASLAALVRRAAGRITILPGGGVRAHNARDILEATGVSELHSSVVFTPPTVS